MAEGRFVSHRLYAIAGISIHTGTYQEISNTIVLTYWSHNYLFTLLQLYGDQRMPSSESLQTDCQYECHGSSGFELETQ